MKTRHIISIVLASAVVLGSSQSIATGLTYDPYEIYYSKYYGIGAESSAVQGEAESIVSTKTNSEESLQDSALQHPSYDYYNTYYDMLDQPEKITKSELVNTEDYADMADPTNYFKW